VSFRPVLRIAWRDASDIMRTRTYVLLVLSPLLLVLLVAMLVVVATAALTIIQLTAPEGAPLGHDRAAVMLSPGADEAAQARFNALIDHLRKEAPSSPEEARIARRFARFLFDARQWEAGIRPSLGEDVVGALSTLQGLNVDITGEDWEHIRGQVPGTFDAAVRFTATASGALRYELALDPALLYSRTMQRRLEDRISSFNTAQREARLPTPAIAVTLQDVRGEAPDLWLVRAVAVLVSLGLAFLYHSIGVQAVAGLIAGERESRTLEVLLSLPITRRQILYGKLLGLVVTTAFPTLLWSLALWLPLARAGITLPYLSLILLLVTLLAFLSSAGCAISAASSSSLAAKNWLGTTNMVLFGVGAGLVALPSAWWPTSEHPLSLVFRVATGAPGTGPLVIVLAGILIGLTLLVLEAGLTVFRRG